MTTVDADGFITEDQPTAGKYLLLEVPNFTGDTSSDDNRKMGSYLRLGAAAANAGDRAQPRHTGEDLAGWVQGFADDTRQRDDPHATNHPPPEAFDPASPANPMRTGSAGMPPPDSMTPVPLDRRAESRVLHSKGGWRDHSDGNRITTTRGDKIEVIRGNYKLVVMGRADQHGQRPGSGGMGQGQGWDISGGLVDSVDVDFATTIDDGTDNDPTRSQDNSTAAGSRKQTDQQWMSVQYKWEQDTGDGRWGWTQTTITGSEVYSANDQGNGKIISKTWVDHMEQYVGSASCRVDSVVQDTYANTFETTTDASGNIFTNNNATWMHEHDSASNQISVVQTAPAITSYQGAVGAVVSNIIAPVFADTMIGVHAESHLGVHLDTQVGAHVDLHILEHLDIHLGWHHDMHVGHGHYELKSNGKMELDTDESTAKVDAARNVSFCDVQQMLVELYTSLVTRTYTKAVTETYAVGCTITCGGIFSIL
jgi:hypothetical protein